MSKISKIEPLGHLEFFVYTNDENRPAYMVSVPGQEPGMIRRVSWFFRNCKFDRSIPDGPLSARLRRAVEEHMGVTSA
jgi:hypothetical protein